MRSLQPAHFKQTINRMGLPTSRPPYVVGNPLSNLRHLLRVETQSGCDYLPTIKHSWLETPPFSDISPLRKLGWLPTILVSEFFWRAIGGNCPLVLHHFPLLYPVHSEAIHHGGKHMFRSHPEGVLPDRQWMLFLVARSGIFKPQRGSDWRRGQCLSHNHGGQQRCLVQQLLFQQCTFIALRVNIWNYEHRFWIRICSSLLNSCMCFKPAHRLGRRHIAP